MGNTLRRRTILIEQNHFLCSLYSVTKLNKLKPIITPMKKLKLILALLAGLAVASVTTALADDEVTITGNMVCGKCTLHETASCQNVVQVTDADGKKVNYYLKHNDISKAAHDPICGGGSEKVTVTGTVTEKDGKKTFTPTKIDVVKSA